MSSSASPPDGGASSSINPSDNLGGTPVDSGHNTVTHADVAVIVSVVVVFSLFLFTVFFFRYLHHKRAAAAAAADVELEDGVTSGGDKLGKPERTSAGWKFGGWKNADANSAQKAGDGDKEMHMEEMEIGIKASTAQDVRDDTPPTKNAGTYHADPYHAV